MALSKKRCEHCGQSFWTDDKHDCPVLAERKEEQAAQRRELERQAREAMKSVHQAQRPKCPRCGFSKVIWQRGQKRAEFVGCSCLGSLLFLPFLLLLPFVFFMKGGRWLCADCGFTWEG